MNKKRFLHFEIVRLTGFSRTEQQMTPCQFLHYHIDPINLNTLKVLDTSLLLPLLGTFDPKVYDISSNRSREFEHTKS